MKKLLLGLSICLTASTAFAADAVVDEMVVVDEAFDWSGVYIGLQAGYLAGDFGVSFPDVPGMSAEPDPEGFVGGIYGGYNYQFPNNLVIGAEGELNAASTDDGKVPLYGEDGLPSDEESWEGEINWTAAIRGRVGYAMDRTLIYAAAGAAFADYEARVYDDEFERDSFSDMATGWTIGLGVEHAFTNNIVARIDYRYSDFGSDSFPAATNPGGTIGTDIDLVTHEVKAGVAWKF